MVRLLHCASFPFHVAIFSFLLLTTAGSPLYAQTSPQRTLMAGDLVITEISPGLSVEGHVISYLELYNASSEPVNLKGLRFSTEEEHEMIDQPVVVEPYSFALLCSRNHTHPDFQSDLVLQELSLSDHGFVEIFQGTERIAKSTWDDADKGRSLELAEVIRALDGVAQAEDYRPSLSFLAAGSFGSPGFAGITRLAFHKSTGDTGKWILAAAPGWMPLASAKESWFMEGAVVGGEAGGNDFLTRGTGILMGSPGKPGRLVATESADARLEVDLPETPSWILLGNPWNQPLHLRDVQPVEGHLESYAAQVWDSATETFRLIEPGEAIKPWKAFLLKNKDASAIHFPSIEQRTDARRETPVESRWIAFELQGGGSTTEQITDLAARLLFHGNSAGGSHPLNSEKLWPLFRNGKSLRSSLIYFIDGSREEPRYLAQHARPYEVTDPFEVRLGHVSWNTAGSYELKWNLDNIPEEWELLLTDLQTGASVNLREQEQFQFEHTGDQQIQPPLTDKPEIHPFEPPETFARFVLTVNPKPEIFQAKQSVEQVPDQVELYQNYPNPFNNQTTIAFYLPEETPVLVSVYNIVGQRMAVLGEGGVLEGGRRHEMYWDASEMPSGIYVVRLEIGNRVLIRKMTLVK